MHRAFPRPCGFGCLRCRSEPDSRRSKSWCTPQRSPACLEPRGDRPVQVPSRGVRARGGHASGKCPPAGPVSGFSNWWEGMTWPNHMRVMHACLWEVRGRIDPDRILWGKPRIRGLPITVYDVLEYLASGMSIDDIVSDFPDLTSDDVRTCLAFAADREKRLVKVSAWDSCSTTTCHLGSPRRWLICIPSRCTSGSWRSSVHRRTRSGSTHASTGIWWSRRTATSTSAAWSRVPTQGRLDPAWQLHDGGDHRVAATECSCDR